MGKTLETQKISLFSSAKNTTQSHITINDYFKGIIEGRWQDEVLKYRAGKSEKTKTPAVMASGLFSGRNDSDLQEHSGVLVIDIDEKDQAKPVDQIKEQLKEIPELLAVHASLGGKGLAAYFRINKAKHAKSFEAITRMLANDYEVVPDLSCSNVGRLRFVSYDPECHINYGAEIWAHFEKKPKETEQAYSHHIYSDNDIEYILSQIKQRQLCIAPDYYSWLRIGFGLASKLGESGRDVFRVISSFYGGKEKISVDAQYDRCLRSDAVKGRGSSIKSFFYYAKQAGCNLTSERTAKIKTIAKIRRKQEGTQPGSMVSGKSDARQYLAEFEGVEGADVEAILDQVWQAPIFELKEDESQLHEIEVFLKSNYKFRLNAITGVVEVNGEPINDYLFNSIYLRTSRIISEKVSKDKIFDLIHSDFTPEYNPIFDWIEKNKHLRKKDSDIITRLAGCIDSELRKTDPKFIEYFLEKWLISIIASAHGIYSILCLVLTGQQQGTGKTNFFRDLLPESLRWLFIQNKLDGKEADVAKLMCSKLIIMDDEFGGKSKQDEKKFKDLVSSDKFSVRMPYQRYFEDIKRLAVLCGTSNEEHILNDLTGNRRIIPIQVNYIDEKKYSEIDKDELFIELYWRWKEAPKAWFLNKEDIERLNEVCFDSKQVAPELELALKYYEKTEKYNPSARFVSASEMRSQIETRSGIKLSQQKLSVSLKSIGYETDRKIVSGQFLRGFWVIEKFNYEPSFDEKTEAAKQNNTDELPF
jgi:hypothetical protein